MGGPTKTTTFNPDWLKDPKFSAWIEEVPNNPRTACCTWCSTTFSLSNMGKRAVTSHAESKKHKNIVLHRSRTHDISVALLGSKPATSNVETNMRNNASVSQCQTISRQSDAESEDQRQGQSGVSQTPVRGITTFLIAENVTRAEILWSLHTIANHYCVRSAAKSVDLFSLMFPDSQIAAKMKLQRTKLGYILVHGLAPYFHNELIKELNGCTDIVVGFDESLNKVVQLGQMDVFVRFWRDQNNRVSTRYLTSTFLNHATAADLLRGFSSALEGIGLKKILQVSMDGPNVNLKFHRDLSDSLVSEPNDRRLVDIGTCGLHSINGAFKTGMKATSWEISGFLSALYVIFKDTPARRGDYTYYSGSKVFPRKFCTVRWLENGIVAERAVTIVPNVRKYLEGIKREKKALPDSKSFKIVQLALKDDLLISKLTFFQSLAAEVEPFLREFQTEKPMAPLLYGTLCDIMRNLMNRFIKLEILSTSNNINTIDVSDKKNLQDLKRIDLGYATRDAIAKVRTKLSDKDILQFRQQCCVGLQKMCEKLQVRSPLTYSLTKGISCLDPTVAMMPTNRDSRIRLALNNFVKNQQISGVVADKAEKQFKTVCCKPRYLDLMKGFSRQQDRLDDLWMSVVGDSKEASKELCSFLKKSLILSHGNADLERGFSINRECLIENQTEQSLIAQRQIYDALNVAGGVDNLTITKSLIHAARNARARYHESMEETKRREIRDETTYAEKKALALELQELEMQKRQLIENTKEKEALLADKIEALKKKCEKGRD